MNVLILNIFLLLNRQLTLRIGILLIFLFLFLLLLLLTLSNLNQNVSILSSRLAISDSAPHVILLLRQVVPGNVRTTRKKVQRSQPHRWNLYYLIVQLMPTIVVHQNTAHFSSLCVVDSLAIDAFNCALTPNVLRVLHIYHLIHDETVVVQITFLLPLLKLSLSFGIVRLAALTAILLTAIETTSTFLICNGLQ
jgi:hypothetical protein